jgi:type II secretory pathway component PulF
MFSNFYQSGEVSGKLDDSLRQLHRIYQEEGTRKLRAVAQWTPRIVYLFVALLIANFVIRGFMNYIQQIRSAGGF